MKSILKKTKTKNPEKYKKNTANVRLLAKTREVLQSYIQCMFLFLDELMRNNVVKTKICLISCLSKPKKTQLSWLSAMMH